MIKTAESIDELMPSFKLRDEVFNQEFRGLKTAGLDFDKFDFHFDHLIILQKDTHRLVGTYRLNCSTFSPESYTALEFDLSMLFLHQGPFLELGRACIHRDFRKGSIISLLWRGIAEYMKLCGAQYLFGCSSLKVNEPREAALVYRHLANQKLVTYDFYCTPTKAFSLPHFDAWFSYFRNPLNQGQQDEAEVLIPPLLRSYLKLGARVASEPAYDEEFDCIDMLTVLHRENLLQSFATKLQIKP